MWRTLITWALGLVVTGLMSVPVRAEASAQWTLMAYLRSSGGLAATAARYLEDFTATREQGLVQVAVQIEQAGRPGWARRIWLDREGVRDYGPAEYGDMDRPEVLAGFLKWAEQQSEAERRVLLVLGHGDPPSGAPLPAQSGGGVQIRTIVGGLAAGSDRPADVVFLDCCYTGTLEVADQLRAHARYLVAPPGLLYEPGLPWDRILRTQVAATRGSARDLARRAVLTAQQYWATQPCTPAGLVAVDLERVGPLSEAVVALAEASLPVMGELAPHLAVARAQALGYGGSEVTDLATLAESLAVLTPLGEVARQAEEVARTARAATVEAWTQGYAGAGGQARGLGMHFPQDPGVWQSHWDGPEPWLLGAAWGPFCQAYAASLSALVEDTRSSSGAAS